MRLPLLCPNFGGQMRTLDVDQSGPEFEFGQSLPDPFHG